MKKLVDEVQLWNLLREGDQKAFGELYQVFVQPLYSYSLSITSNKELIKDCLQDLFVELWKNHQNLGPTTSVKFYLMASIKRKLVRHLEGSLKTAGNDFQYMLNQSETFQSAEMRLIEQEGDSRNQKVLHMSLGKLSKRQRQAISLKYFHNMDTDQISSTMKINPQSVYNLIFGALKSLKMNLETELVYYV